MKKRVIAFLSSFATKVGENEKSSYVELMMDDHFCIKYNGAEYYIPENSMLYTGEDEEVCDYLKEKYLL